MGNYYPNSHNSARAPFFAADVAKFGARIACTSAMSLAQQFAVVRETVETREVVSPEVSLVDMAAGNNTTLVGELAEPVQA